MTRARETARLISNNTFTINSSSNNVGIASTIPTSKLSITGDLRVSGVTTSQDFDSLSDINFKTDIQKVQNALNLVENLEGVRFVWKSDNKPSVGVIAQQIEEYIPELVHTSEYKTVNYNGLIGVLIEAVKELKKEVEELKEKINK